MKNSAVYGRRGVGKTLAALSDSYELHHYSNKGVFFVECSNDLVTLLNTVNQQLNIFQTGLTYHIDKPITQNGFVALIFALIKNGVSVVLDEFQRFVETGSNCRGIPEIMRVSEITAFIDNFF